ncbi:MAG: TrpR-like protein YerC/YecD [Clostridiales bacterium]|nr:TrpR-like protein YerC/YecD [Clostridiales bacterium]
MNKFSDTQDESVIELYNAISHLESSEEVDVFLEDLLTINEIQSIAQRFHVALLLSDGIKYTEIEKRTGASTATISRVKKCLIYGSGYKKIIDKTRKESKV